MQVLPMKRQRQPVAIVLPVNEQSAQMKVISTAVSNFSTIKSEVPCMTLLLVRVFFVVPFVVCMQGERGWPD